MNKEPLILIIAIALILGTFMGIFIYTHKTQDFNTCEHGVPYFLYCPKCNTLTK